MNGSRLFIGDVDPAASVGMKPGAKVGKLLEEIREARAAGELTTREEALEYIRKSLLTEKK